MDVYCKRYGEPMSPKDTGDRARFLDYLRRRKNADVDPEKRQAVDDLIQALEAEQSC